MRKILMRKTRINVNREELYELLDIEEPADFQYFETIASLLECEEEIPYEELYALLQAVDRGELAMLIEDYFEEIVDFLPEDDAEFYLLIDQIRRSLKGLARGSGEESVLASLTEELDRFRLWYSLKSQVGCKNLDSGEEEICCLRDALALARLEKLEGERYSFDFSSARGYPLDDYIASFADLIAAGEAGEEEE